MTPKDYLERALRPTRGSDPGVAAKNRIRKSITTLFPDRECFCLVRPVSNEKQLQNLDALPAAQLRPSSARWVLCQPCLTSVMGTLRVLAMTRTQMRS